MASSVSTAEVKVVPEKDNFLQRHVAFFDRNKDGIVYPSETFQGFRAIGCGYLLSTFAAVFINISLSSKTRPGKGFSFSFPIEVKNINLGIGIHSSDSGVYDKDGRFVASKFEEIFAKHAHTHRDALTNKELKELLKANREPNDCRGGILAFGEWKVLYNLCKDKNGLLHKETVRAVYDGSLFEQLEKQRSSQTPKNHS